jgi:hypothetical protein
MDVSIATWIGVGVALFSLVSGIGATFTTMKVKTGTNSKRIDKIEVLLENLQDSLIAKMQNEAPWVKERSGVLTRLDHVETSVEKMDEKLDKISENQAVILAEIKKNGRNGG